MGIQYNPFTGQLDLTGSSGGGGGGSVDSVTATSPLSSTGGADPNISIQQANSTQSGYLSSTDWNTFNDKTTLQVDTLTLNSTQAGNQAVTLSHIPVNPGQTVLLVENAPNMFYSVDFTVSSNQLSWSGLALSGILSSGDNLTIMYGR